jgi:CheY-like chemotaxis protein
MGYKLSCILLVDDDAPTNFLNEEIIREVECVDHVQIAETGQEALDYLANRGQYIVNGDSYPQPDLIFLDINMPGMDGWEFLQEYGKLSPGQRGKMIVVMLTTSLNPDDEVKAKTTNGISGFITKPLTKEMVQDILERHFRVN